MHPTCCDAADVVAEGAQGTAGGPACGVQDQVSAGVQVASRPSERPAVVSFITLHLSAGLAVCLCSLLKLVVMVRSLNHFPAFDPAHWSLSALTCTIQRRTGHVAGGVYWSRGSYANQRVQQVTNQRIMHLGLKVLCTGHQSMTADRSFVCVDAVSRASPWTLRQPWCTHITRRAPAVQLSSIPNMQ